ncbi:MAG: LysR family transcriptional regulator [Candidatus Omnitrophota bacterium]
MKVKSKVWLEKRNGLILGEGKAQLLKEIDRSGSINKAAQSMGVSFRKAWSSVTAVEKRLGARLIERQKGGSNGGGSLLTPSARTLIRKYDRLKQSVDRFADKKFKEIFHGGI